MDLQRDLELVKYLLCFIKEHSYEFMDATDIEGYPDLLDNSDAAAVKRERIDSTIVLLRARGLIDGEKSFYADDHLMNFDLHLTDKGEDFLKTLERPKAVTLIVEWAEKAGFATLKLVLTHVMDRAISGIFGL
jgi:hypothetical protein